MPKLIVVGSGIKSLAHLTQETITIIQKATKVLYLVNEDLLKDWIEKEAKSSESLEPLYFSSDDRAKAYQAITNYIVDEYSKCDLLCVVFYGHPTVFADSALKAVKTINEQNGNAIILPAVSSLDCLFADLQIDPGDGGLFCIEATELLLNERKLDPLSHVILYQVANLGTRNLKKTDKIGLLVDYLCQFYSSNQRCCIYEAAILPGQVARCDWVQLSELPFADLSAQSTLYLPPLAYEINEREIHNES